MKNILLRVILIVAGVSTSFVGSGNAQTSDSIVYRLRWTILRDSTIFKYEIGSIKLIQPGGSKFLDFVNPSGLNPDDFFTSDSFQISSSIDSVSFSRFASFDDKNYLRPTTIDTGDRSAVQSLGNTYKNRYYGLNISPDPSYFGSASYMMYVLELRRFDNHNLITILDTLKCYVNGSGQLRFRNYPASLNLRKAALFGTVGLSAYLYVHIVHSLPTDTAILGYAFQFSGSNQPAEGYYSYENQEGIPTKDPTSSPIPFFSGLPTKANTTLLGVVSPNPSNTILNIHLNGVSKGTILIEIFSEAGAKLKSLQFPAVSAPSDIITIPISDLLSGSYGIALTSDGITTFDQFQVIHK
jgi:hypothetical protein